METWNITARELEQKKNEGIKLCIADIRKPEEYNKWHIDGSVNMYIDDEELIITDSVKNELCQYMQKCYMIILCCENGITGMRCVIKLRKYGIKSYNLYGGIKEYKLLFGVI